MMRRRRWLLAVGITVVVAAVVAMFAAKSFGTTPAFQTSDCSSYKLPPGATLGQDAVSPDRSVIRIFYEMPGGGRGELDVPFNALAATCTDPLVRAVLASAQETDKKIQAGMCKFVGDILAGRTHLPPDREPYFDRKYAEEWYQKACLGAK